MTTEEQAKRARALHLSFLRLIFEMVEDQGWRAYAACRGSNPQDFVPPAKEGRGGGGIQASRETETRLARAYDCCFECPVTDECKAYADSTETQFGVWGGQMRYNPSTAKGGRQGYTRKSMGLPLRRRIA